MIETLICMAVPVIFVVGLYIGLKHGLAQLVKHLEKNELRPNIAFFRQVLKETDLGEYQDDYFVFVCLKCRMVFNGQDDCLDHREKHGLGHSTFVHWDRWDDGDCVEPYCVEKEFLQTQRVIPGSRVV